jgi:putative ABC transport system substrate-binding protein
LFANSLVTRLALSAVLLLGSAAIQAQQTTGVQRIGVAIPLSPSPEPPTLRSLREGLRELGYVEGRNVIVEARFTAGRPERFPELLNELVRMKVDVIVVGSTPGTLAAKKATTTIPIVFAGIVDPDTHGIVASLARPGGNVTGATFGVGGSGFAGKWVELLKEAFPGVSHVAVLWNPANPSHSSPLREVQAAAQSLRVKVDALDAGNATTLDRAFATIGADGPQGIIVIPDAFFIDNRAKLAQMVATKRLPAVFPVKLFADAGGLMAYGGSLEDSFKRAAKYVDKILKGAKPADLPVDRPTRFELVINLKTARAMGFKIPQSVLARADHIIE